jgi:catechol 2,3-dioxygenase-like lactoylglutathione lyase family enzyme
MRSLFTIIILMILLKAKGQTASVPVYEPYFSGIVVSDADSSAKWYQSLLGLKEKEKMLDPAGSYKVIILESPKMLLELLELKGSLHRKNILEGKQEGIRIQGHLKIGFKVADIDEWLKHLSSFKVNVPQVWTNPTTKKRNFIISDPDGNLVQFFD